MNQAVVQIPLNGLLVSIAVIVCVIIYLKYKSSTHDRGGTAQQGPFLFRTKTICRADSAGTDAGSSSRAGG